MILANSCSDNYGSVRIVELSSADTSEWNRIVHDNSLNPSLSFDWQRIVATSHGLCPLVAEFRNSNEDLVTLIPFMIGFKRELGLRLRTINLLSNVTSYHNDIISNTDASKALGNLLFLAEREQADIICLHGILDESPLSRALSAAADLKSFSIFTLPGDTSPYLPITGRFKDLLASKAKKFRYKSRKRREQLDQNPDLEMRWYPDVHQIPELMRAIERIEFNSWKLNAGHAIHTRPEEYAYYEALLPYLAKHDRLIANVLWNKDTPVAYNICCRWGGWIGQLKTSFDTNFQSISPGMTVIDAAIERAHLLDAEEFDFLGGADQHKLGWSKSSRSHTDYFLYAKNSTKARFAATIKTLRR